MKTGDFFHTAQQKRILTIDACLRTGAGMTRQQICRRLQTQGFATSLRTFMRDIDYLRKDLQAPVNHDSLPHGPGGTKAELWFYSDPSWTLGSFRMTQGTLWALLVAQRVVERYAGLPVAAELKKAYDQLAESLNCTVTIKHDVLAPISFAEEEPETIPCEVWNPILKATLKHKVLRIEYAKGWDDLPGKVAARIVRPYHIVNLQGSWYLLATAADDTATVRQYAVRRIRRATVENDAFLMPGDFDIKKVLARTFGRFIGDPDTTVALTVRFAARVAPLVMERQFHPSERKVMGKDGTVLVSFPVTSSGPWPFYHVIGWILSWGPDAEVLGPPEVRQGVADACRQTLAKYA
jgi:predicted DNA-binding transcriptional regulator YafY